MNDCGRCVSLTQVAEQLHTQRCENKEEKHEEESQIPHLQRDSRERERERRISQRRVIRGKINEGQQTSASSERK